MTAKGLRQLGKSGICAKPAPGYSLSGRPLSACMQVSTGSLKLCLEPLSKSLQNVHTKEGRGLGSSFQASPGHFAFKGGYLSGVVREIVLSRKRSAMLCSEALLEAEH